MRSEELPLYEAIYDVREEIVEPGAQKWIIDEHEELCRMIQRRLPFEAAWSKMEILNAWEKFRKAAAHKASLIVEVARAHGRHCFMRHRGAGPCSDDLTLDRIVPGSRAGEYSVSNCILMCGCHNSQKGMKSLEQYLSDIRRVGDNEADDAAMLSFSR